jgi:hypothetical protein
VEPCGWRGLSDRCSAPSRWSGSGWTAHPGPRAGSADEAQVLRTGGRTGHRTGRFGRGTRQLGDVSPARSYVVDVTDAEFDTNAEFDSNAKFNLNVKFNINLNSKFDIRAEFNSNIYINSKFNINDPARHTATPRERRTR